MGGSKIIYMVIGAVIGSGSMAAARVTFNLPAFCPAEQARPVAEVVRDVAYYRQHDSERAEKMTQCQNDPGRLGETANCLNASRAEFKESFQGGGPPKLRLE